MKRIVIAAALLASSLASRGQSPMADQAVCARQAQKVYREEIIQFTRNSPGADGSFTSHYNPTLGHCFVKIFEMTDGFPLEVRETVTDAFEGVMVARFAGRQNTLQDQRENRALIPEICEVAGSDLRYEKDFTDYSGILTGGTFVMAGTLKNRAEFEAEVLAAYGVQ